MNIPSDKKVFRWVYVGNRIVRREGRIDASKMFVSNRGWYHPHDFATTKEGLKRKRLEADLRFAAYTLHAAAKELRVVLQENNDARGRVERIKNKIKELKK